MNQKGFINIVLIIGVVVVVGILGYVIFLMRPALLMKSADTSTTQKNPTNTSDNELQKITVPENLTKNNANDCSLFSDATFRSVNQYEVGLSPNGQEVMGYWTVVFKNGEFGWSHSDMVEGGSYLCNNNVVYAKLNNQTITASYDESRKVLIWSGVAYEKIK